MYESISAYQVVAVKAIMAANSRPFNRGPSALNWSVKT